MDTTTITVKTSYYYETIEETNAKSDYLLSKLKVMYYLLRIAVSVLQLPAVD